MGEAGDQDAQRLLPRRAVLPIVVADFAAAGVFAFLAYRFHDQHRAGGLDRAIDGRLAYHLFPYRIALRGLVDVGAPLTVALLGLGLALGSLVTGRRRGAVLSIVGPGLAALTTDALLKPVVGRTFAGSLAFPSGHTTGTAALATVFAVLMLGPSSPAGLSTRARRIVVVLAVAVSAGTAIGLVALRFHYSTDTVGGGCVAVIVVTVVAMTIDACSTAADRHSRDTIRTELPA